MAKKLNYFKKIRILAWTVGQWTSKFLLYYSVLISLLCLFYCFVHCPTVHMYFGDFVKKEITKQICFFCFFEVVFCFSAKLFLATTRKTRRTEKQLLFFVFGKTNRKTDLFFLKLFFVFLQNCFSQQHEKQGVQRNNFCFFVFGKTNRKTKSIFFVF